MYFKHKPDFEESYKRYEAFFHGETLDRPLVSVIIPVENPVPVPKKEYKSHRERWLDVEFRAECDAINIGNSHTLAAAIRGQRVYGLFEHHTGMLDALSLESLVRKLQNNELTNEEIFNGGGHGAATHPDMGQGYEHVAITGPRRSMADGLKWHEVAPYGDMMLTGCFGMLAGLGII